MVVFGELIVIPLLEKGVFGGSSPSSIIQELVFLKDKQEISTKELINL